MANSPPLLLLIPSILIVLVILTFIILIIRDKLATSNLAIPSLNKISKEEKKEEKEIKKKEENETMKMEEIKEEKKFEKEIDYYSKIIDLQGRLSQIDTETAYEELIKIIRNFFSDYLDLNYEFTYGELKKELKEKKKKILISSDALSKIEYGPHKLPRNELIKMVEEFKNLLIKLNSRPKSGWDPIKDAKKIQELVIKGNKISRKDINKTINIYKEIYYLYYTLPEAEKIKLYSPIIKFYKLIR